MRKRTLAWSLIFAVLSKYAPFWLANCVINNWNFSLITMEKK